MPGHSREVRTHNPPIGRTDLFAHARASPELETFRINIIMDTIWNRFVSVLLSALYSGLLFSKMQILWPDELSNDCIFHTANCRMMNLALWWTIIRTWHVSPTSNKPKCFQSFFEETKLQKCQDHPIISCWLWKVGERRMNQNPVITMMHRPDVSGFAEKESSTAECPALWEKLRALMKRMR